MSRIFLEAKRITKKFGSFTANSEVNFTAKEGHIHGIVGENGAGKSTLMKILYGMLTPDEGSLSVKGKQVEFKSSHDALRLGIGMVHQHFMLISRLSVLENLILGAESTKALGWIDKKKALEEFHLLQSEEKLIANEEVRHLNVGEQQKLEILKLLFRTSECLIFDEPTGVLAPQEVDAFLESLLALKAKGKTIILISHKLHEVLKVCDEITVMRGGKSLPSLQAKDTSLKELARLLVGREVSTFGSRYSRHNARGAKPALRAKNIYLKKLKNFDCEIYPGEILGIAGITGNGQKELIEALTGFEKIESGEVFIGEELIPREKGIRYRKRKGLSYIPEDRHRDGLVLDLSLTENFYFGAAAYFGNYFLWPKSKVQKELLAAIQKYEIKTQTTEAKARSLSGGNQQKVILARELLGNPKILIAAEPTRGVDIGAIELIHLELMRRREEGLSILLISSELDELLSLSDRILVLREGKKTAEFSDLSSSSDFHSLRFQMGEAMICHS